MIKLMDILTEASNTKKGFEVIRTLTHGHPLKFERMTKANWVQHHAKGIVFGGKQPYKNEIFKVQIFSTGKDKHKIEFYRSMADDFGLSQQGKGKQKPMKVVKNVEGDMLYSALKQHLGI